MAIKFDCPHCGHHYRLKDELAGKVGGVQKLPQTKSPSPRSRSPLRMRHDVRSTSKPPPLRRTGRRAEGRGRPFEEADRSRVPATVRTSGPNRSRGPGRTRFARIRSARQARQDSRTERRTKRTDWRRTKTRNCRRSRKTTSRSKPDGVMDAADSSTQLSVAKRS